MSGGVILIVDDDEENLDLLGRILAMQHYEALKARSGKEALRLVTQKTPQLAILDVMMPDMDGFTLCQTLRQPPLSVQFPIILLTALNTKPEQQHALDCGANEIWPKPFEMETFNRRIKEYLFSAKP